MLTVFLDSISPCIFVCTAGDKAPASDRKGTRLSEGIAGRGKTALSASISGSDPAGVSVTVHPPPVDSNDGEQGEGQDQLERGAGGKALLVWERRLAAKVPDIHRTLMLSSLSAGSDTQVPVDFGDSVVVEQPQSGEHPSADDGAENER